MPAFHLPAWLLSSCLLFASTGCELCTDPTPATDLAPVAVSYTQTQCADKWGTASTPAQLAALATAYLAQQGITLLSPQASQVNPPVVCSACSCPTGVILVGAVAPNEVAAVQALGFLRK